jgi:WhiB family redox-sensing transcriptional regulator
MILPKLPKLPGAVCAEADPEAWFPENDGDGKPILIGHAGYAMKEAKTPKRICKEMCPVRDQCLQEAIDRREQHGIWGGLTTKERQKLMKQRRVV